MTEEDNESTTTTTAITANAEDPPAVAVTEEEEENPGVFLDESVQPPDSRSTSRHCPRTRKQFWFLLLLVTVIVLVSAISVAVTRNKSGSSSSSSPPPDSSSSGSPPPDSGSSSSPPPGSWLQVGNDIDSTREETTRKYALVLSDDGRIVAVGNRDDEGLVRVYEFQAVNDASGSSSSWRQLGNDIRGEAVGDQFSAAVSLSKDGLTLAVGGHLNNSDDRGHVRVLKFDGDDWVQLGTDMEGEAAGNLFGYAVSLAGDGAIVAIGGQFNSQVAQRAGHVRVLQYNGIDWVQLGADIDGQAYGDQFGSAVSLSTDGRTVAVGARFHDTDDANDNVGHVRVFAFNGNDWNILGDEIQGQVPQQEFGYSVALGGEGLICAIGNASNELRVYQLNSGSWQLLGETITAGQNEDSFLLISLARSGQYLAVSEQTRSGLGQVQHKVIVYMFKDGSWVQLGQQLDSLTFALSGDGGTLAVGIIDSSGGREVVQVLRAAA
jgi:hypothetical protein